MHGGPAGGWFARQRCRCRLPDGRTFVIQCKRYAPSSTIASRAPRDLLGAKVHFRADVAVFVTTIRLSRPFREVRGGARHSRCAPRSPRLVDHGASLLTLSRVNGRGQGDSRHRARWKQAYGK
nr:restriction endonuclease [Streptomyces antibioticus]